MKKYAAAVLALLCLLASPGLESYAAAAAVLRAQQAAVPAGTALGPLGRAAGNSPVRLAPVLGSAQLRGTLTAIPVPLVHAGALSPSDLSPEPSALAAPTPLPLPGLVDSPLAPVPTHIPAPAQTGSSLEGLAQGAAAVEQARGRQASPEAGRSALDRLFESRPLPAAAELAAGPDAGTQPSGLDKPAALAAASPRGPPDLPRQSLARSAFVGWFAAVVPLLFTFTTVLLASSLGYHLHPSYQGPATAALTAQKVAATMTMAAVMAPVSEELIFRSGLMGAARKLTRRIPRLGDFWLPALASSAVFVLLHETADPVLMLTRLVHSLILSRTFHKEGLAAAIFAHAFFNGLLTLPMVLAWLGVGPAAPLLLLAPALAMSALAWRVLRSQRAQRASGRLVPFVLKEKQALGLGALLLMGYYLLAPNVLWFLGALGYGRYALRANPARTAAPQAASTAAPDFGAKNGAEIANKDSVLREVDRALGRRGPPALEYIFVRPLAVLKLDRGSGSGTNPYGHAVVRYTMPDGTQKVMNIVGAKGRDMVNFLRPEDYLYGTGVFDTGSEQGGVYNRGMFSVRVEELPPEKILALDRYYTELAARAKAKQAGFKLLIGRLLNFLARLLRLRWPEWGNCALWTSKGLAAAGLLGAPTPWPKHILVNLLEKYGAQDPANVHVVSYRRVAHAVQSYGKLADTHGLVAPLHLLKTVKYWDLERFSDAVVEVPDGSMTAQVRRVRP